uniref:Uncharacterized protein n=1 Tax=Rhizophora mucronata TaxID=61149 RepID=A0A2P2JDH8_RHIMU
MTNKHTINHSKKSQLFLKQQ